MKNNWLHYVYGYVRMTIEGQYAERFLNQCIHNDIDIWNIKRVGKEKMVCYLALEDVRKIKKIVKMTDCKVSFTKRIGIPFLTKKMAIRGGFTAGIAGFLFLIFLLSNMVWGISIQGASPKVEHQLKQIVQDIGIKRGKFLFSLPSVEDIQKVVTDSLEEATWVGVQLNGTTYHFEVVEQTLPEEKGLISPRHLVSKKKAVIHEMFVEKGQAMVKPNQFVNKGELLVSGFIGKEGKTEIVAAQAEVFGEIWYKSDVSVPLSTKYETLTGDSKTKYYLSFFNVDIPIWGFRSPQYEHYEVFERNYAFRLLNWTLPVQYKSKQALEKQETLREYSEEEAVQVGIEMAKVELNKSLGDDAEIVGEKVLHQAKENGKVILKIHYQVIEEITSEQPIIQGD
ncbi:sporulation protein YqfD [Bacillus alkalicellulosilyticus]|uniref:sporulation protein YqfD n=1 Tax=Alkalihalobacterium alkalicellulosilyticum TaxID=1912214 RepID=UPI000996876A|nr:sporulation protein YqfD [Bacillus alkalicellulosilyticus]